MTVSSIQCCRIWIFWGCDWLTIFCRCTKRPSERWSTINGLRWPGQCYLTTSTIVENKLQIDFTLHCITKNLTNLNFSNLRHFKVFLVYYPRINVTVQSFLRYIVSIRVIWTCARCCILDARLPITYDFTQHSLNFLFGHSLSETRWEPWKVAKNNQPKSWQSALFWSHNLSI